MRRALIALLAAVLALTLAPGAASAGRDEIRKPIRATASDARCRPAPSLQFDMPAGAFERGLCERRQLDEPARIVLVVVGFLFQA